MSFRIPSEKHFLGRGQELDALYRIASEARQGIASSILLFGKHGTGKTELLYQLFNLLFWKQDRVAPFIYTINPASVSASDFSKGYLTRFIRQRLSFEKKDAPLVHADGLSLKRLLNIAEESGAQWASDIIKEYQVTERTGDPTELFLFAINAPYLSYTMTGVPVFVLLDEFQRSMDFYEHMSRDNGNLWTLFEKPIKSANTPHIISGSQAKLNDMFFQRTRIGKSLETVNLTELNKEASRLLFVLLCEGYNIMIDDDSLSAFVELFKGNPFYIRSFLQAVRHEGKTFSEDDLWKVYCNEIFDGKLYNYWVATLKTYMPRFDLRKTSLELLHHICGENRSFTPSDLSEALSISEEEVNTILSFLEPSGIIKMSFTTLKFAGDDILADFITGLYSKEILGETLSAVEETIIGKRSKPSKTSESPVYEVTVPAVPKAELVAVRALEQIAGNLNLPPEITRDLQIALIDLFTTLFNGDEARGEQVQMKFKSHGDTYVIEVKSALKETAIIASGLASKEQLIRKHTDNIRFETMNGGTKIILTKKLQSNPLPAPENSEPRQKL